MTVQTLIEVDLRNARDAIEYYYETEWTDGLPVVPPIREFVDEFLAQTSRDPGEVVLTQAHLNRSCTVEQAAINSVMAGCRPEYFPVVLAALDALNEMGIAIMQSTTGQAAMLIVNGPIRNRIGLNCTGNILGSGDRPNATIGRAIRLVVINVMEVRPHDLDQSSQGTPAKFSCCFGENEEESPWDPMHVDLGYPATTSTVTARFIRSDLHVEHRSTQTPEHILYTLADSLSYGGGIYEAPPFNRNNGAVVIMGPEHANIVASGGWTKEAVRQFLYEHYGKTMRELRSFGKIIDLEDEPDDKFIVSARAPENLTIVVAGASNAGVSTVGTSFSYRQATAVIEEK
jgi:hypothetical protein